MKIIKEVQRENYGGIYCWKEYEIFKLQYALPRCAYFPNIQKQYSEMANGSSLFGFYVRFAPCEYHFGKTLLFGTLFFLSLSPSALFSHSHKTENFI